MEAEFDYEQGQFIYDVEFIADHTQYNYWIKASSGVVVKKDVKLLPGATEAAQTEAPEAASTEKEDTKKETTSTAANPKERTTGETKPSESNASSAVDKTGSDTFSIVWAEWCYQSDADHLSGHASRRYLQIKRSQKL